METINTVETDKPTHSRKPMPPIQAKTESQGAKKSAFDDPELAQKLEHYSLESIVELKLSQFLDQIGTFYPEELYSTILKETEKPLLNQILLRTGGNQVHAARILGINRNTLRKKMSLYGFR